VAVTLNTPYAWFEFTPSHEMPIFWSGNFGHKVLRENGVFLGSNSRLSKCR